MIPPTLLCDTCGATNQSQAAYCRSCGHSLQAVKPTIYHSATGRLLVNILLKQRYRIIVPIGQGGMGAVYQAEDTQLGNRKVAVKEMSQSGLSPQEQKEAADAFRQEAILLAGLQHRSLPSIFDHFEENGRWYLVMSFIEGETLADYLSHSQRGKLPLDEVLQIGTQLCTVLSYLHNQQPAIIFRDLKPSNIMRTPDGHIYLIDFGIARHFKPGQAKDTAYYGSMGYAPPEQYGKAQTTPRSDIYSLGVVLYQLLSGHNPFTTPFQFPSLQSLVPTVPMELATLITHMLELDENKRPASVLVVSQKLQSLATSPRGIPPTPLLQPTVTAGRSPRVASPPPFVPPLSPPIRVSPGTKGNGWAVGLLIGLVILVSSVVVWTVAVKPYFTTPTLYNSGYTLTQTPTPTTTQAVHQPQQTIPNILGTWQGTKQDCGGSFCYYRVVVTKQIGRSLEISVCYNHTDTNFDLQKPDRGCAAASGIISDNGSVSWTTHEPLINDSVYTDDCLISGDTMTGESGIHLTRVS